MAHKKSAYAVAVESIKSGIINEAYLPTETPFEPPNYLPASFISAHCRENCYYRVITSRWLITLLWTEVER